MTQPSCPARWIRFDARSTFAFGWRSRVVCHRRVLALHFSSRRRRAKPAADATAVGRAVQSLVRATRPVGHDLLLSRPSERHARVQWQLSRTDDQGASRRRRGGCGDQRTEGEHDCALARASDSRRTGRRPSPDHRTRSDLATYAPDPAASSDAPLSLARPWVDGRAGLFRLGRGIAGNRRRRTGSGLALGIWRG